MVLTLNNIQEEYNQLAITIHQIANEDNKDLMSILKSKDKVEEIRLVNRIQEILNICKFGIPNRYINEEIYQYRRSLMNYIMIIQTNPSEEEISLIMNGNIRVPPTREVSTEESIG